MNLTIDCFKLSLEIIVIRYHFKNFLIWLGFFTLCKNLSLYFIFLLIFCERKKYRIVYFFTKIYSRSCTQNWTVTPPMDPHTMISTAGQRTDGLTSQGHRLVSISTPILWPPSNLNRFQMFSRFRLVHLQSSEYNISLKFLKSNWILVVLMECHIFTECLWLLSSE